MKAILIDTTKCTGCNKCVNACAKEFNQGMYLPWRWSSNDGLSFNRYISVTQLYDNHYIRRQCMHCLEPACVSVCPVGALQKTKEGPVIYDKNICIGCRYCMMACPYGIPKHSWGSSSSYIHKCSMCYENRIQTGKIPACIEACPEEAAIFGNRKELIKIAKNRIKTNPQKYIQRIFGEKELGGTSVLYISDMDLNFLGMNKTLGEKALPEYTEIAMKSVPSVFIGVGAIMYGIYWVYERKKNNLINNQIKISKEKNSTSIRKRFLQSFYRFLKNKKK